ncbi:MAG: Large-conductance mechanosensitive channel [Sodalis sp.]|nr:MAG: Large-conductance mechanosensitive channel [Sodalis sp.]
MMEQFYEFLIRIPQIRDAWKRDHMAVDIIIGVAFGKSVSSLVTNVTMPPIGLPISGIDSKQLILGAHAMQEDIPAVIM